MSIKYNERGEVISVNGLTTGHFLGTPMQDALGTEEENSAYGTELKTVTRNENTVENKQVEPIQANLDQNDPTAPDYVKGRLCHYGETILDLELPGRRVVMHETPLVVGEMYVVILTNIFSTNPDGEMQVFEAVEHEDGSVGISNLHFLASGYEIYYNCTVWNNRVYADRPCHMTIKKLKQLPDTFISDNIARMDYVESSNPVHMVDYQTIKFSDVRTACTRGKIILFKINYNIYPMINASIESTDHSSHYIDFARIDPINSRVHHVRIKNDNTYEIKHYAIQLTEQV